MESVNFDRAADFYDATRGFPVGVAEQIGQFIAKMGNLRTDDIVLEIGIGTGRIALPLAPHVRFVAGVDISKSMINVLLEKRQTEPVFPVLADAHDLPFADNGFNAVNIVHVLHLVPDPVRILHDVKRVLKHDGRLFHCFNQIGDDDNPMAAAWNANRPKRQHGHNWESTASALEKSSYEIENMFTYVYSYTDTPQGFLQPIESRAWSSTWDASNADLAIGVNAIKRAIEEHYDGDYDKLITRQANFTMQILRPSA